jgi:hypothetical protein
VTRVSQAERATKSGVAALLKTLAALGANDDIMDQFIAWNLKKQSVSLRLAAEEKCVFIKHTTREVEDAVKSVTTLEASMFKASTTKKTFTKVDEWFWKFDVDYKIIAFAGSDPANAVVLQQHHR